eukprot:Pgem_evm1s16920
MSNILFSSAVRYNDADIQLSKQLVAGSFISDSECASSKTTQPNQYRPTYNGFSLTNPNIAPIDAVRISSITSVCANASLPVNSDVSIFSMQQIIGENNVLTSEPIITTTSNVSQVNTVKNRYFGCSVDPDVVPTLQYQLQQPGGLNAAFNIGTNVITNTTFFASGFQVVRFDTLNSGQQTIKSPHGLSYVLKDNAVSIDIQDTNSNFQCKGTNQNAVVSVNINTGNNCTDIDVPDTINRKQFNLTGKVGSVVSINFDCGVHDIEITPTNLNVVVTDYHIKGGSAFSFAANTM